MHVYKDLIQCKSVCDVKPGIDPYPYLLGRGTDDGQISYLLQPVKSQNLVSKTQSVLNRCKDLFEQKKYFGVRCTLTTANIHLKIESLILLLDLLFVIIKMLLQCCNCLSWPCK